MMAYFNGASRMMPKTLAWLLHPGRDWPVIALAAVLFLLPAPGETAAQTPPASGQAAAPPPSTAIPPAEIAARAAEIPDLLRTLTTTLAPGPAMATIQQSLPEFSGQTEREFAATLSALQEQPTLETLEAQQQLWQRRQFQATDWLHLLTQRAGDLETGLNRLTDLQGTWSRTLDAAQATLAPAPIIQQIETAQAAIKAAQGALQAQQDTVLDLQSRVASALARCDDALAQITQAQNRAVGGLLTRSAPPIWNAGLWRRARTEGPAQVRHIAARQWAAIRQYLHDPTQGMPLHVGIFVVLALLLSAARRQVQRWAAAGQGLSFTTTVFDYPYAGALFVALLVATSPALPTPPSIRNLQVILALAPLIRLVRPVLDPRLAGLYALGGLYVLDTLRDAFGGVPLIEQALLLLETVGGMVVLGWALVSGKLRRSPAPAKGLAWLDALRMVAILFLIALSVALVAGVLGYMGLARLLTAGVLASAVMALAASAFVQVLSGVAALALRAWPLRRLQMVQHHRNLLERRFYRVLVWLAIGSWLIRWLNYIGLLQPVLSFLQTVLAARFERGAISFSLGDVVAFFLTVWAAYLLSAFIRFLLQEEVYPRKGTPLGTSYAFSSLVHYIILTLGFLLGLGILGMDFTKVSVLLGALGVGIGFGLQSVVNNFVSGLILLFERPIRVGDTVQTGDFQGEVRRIGIRASVVRTVQGADIIVPNSQFISANVTNWTLSDQLRRIDLPVGVNYGAAPKQVIELLEAVARADPRVLHEPSPRALLLGYGDNSINFELRAWTGQFADWVRIRSDLAVAVYEAVYAAGLSFPFPQREVRLLRDPETGASPPPLPVEHSEPPAGRLSR